MITKGNRWTMPSSTGYGFAKEQTEVFKEPFSLIPVLSGALLECCLEVLKQKVLTEFIYIHVHFS